MLWKTFDHLADDLFVLRHARLFFVDDVAEETFQIFNPVFERRVLAAEQDEPTKLQILRSSLKSEADRITDDLFAFSSLWLFMGVL